MYSISHDIRSNDTAYHMTMVKISSNIRKRRMTQSPTEYSSGTVNSKMANSKFHLIRSYCEIFFYHFPNISH